MESGSMIRVTDGCRLGLMHLVQATHMGICLTD